MIVILCTLRRTNFLGIFKDGRSNATKKNGTGTITGELGLLVLWIPLYFMSRVLIPCLSAPAEVFIPYLSLVFSLTTTLLVLFYVNASSVYFCFFFTVVHELAKYT